MAVILAGCQSSLNSPGVADGLHRIVSSEHNLEVNEVVSMFGQDIAEKDQTFFGGASIYKGGPNLTLTYLWIANSSLFGKQSQEIRIDVKKSLCVTPNYYRKHFGLAFKDDVNPVHVQDGKGGYLKMVKFGVVFEFRSGKSQSYLTFSGQGVTDETCVSSFRVIQRHS